MPENFPNLVRHKPKDSRISVNPDGTNSKKSKS